jgi:F-type H+-transporting ATPase subunit b
MKKKHIIKIFSLLALLVINLVFVSIIFASSGGGEEAHPSLVKEYAYKIINFVLIFGIVIYFARKPVANMLKQRTELIKKTLKEAQEAKEVAQKALQEAQTRLQTKDKEIEEILSMSKQAGEQEKARLIEESERLKERIFEQAKVNIEYELKGAKDALKAEAVEIAMELAEKKIKEKLTKEEQEKLLQESLTKIGGKG